MSETDLETAKLAGASAIGMNYEESEPPGTQLDLVEFVKRRSALDQIANMEAATRMCVDLTGVDLAGADLSKADLSETIGLTQAQLDDAFGDDQTVLPSGLTIKRR